MASFKAFGQQGNFFFLSVRKLIKVNYHAERLLSEYNLGLSK